MYFFKMSRWLRGAIWAAGSCVVWCPVCVCLSGSGAWWVCACAVGLITITIGSGYTSWTVFNNILRHGPESYTVFARAFGFMERVVERGHIKRPSMQDKSRPTSTLTVQGLGGSNRAIPTVTQEVVMQEVAVSATSLHNFLVMPWYCLVSPDNLFSYQIKDILEDMLTSMCRRVRESGSITSIASGLIHIYMQHYRQYYRALRKISKKHRECEPLSPAAVQELQSRYKPLHPALKSPETLQLYYRKLAQIILHHYLPAEVIRCDLILISVRDLFAQNVLQAFVDLLCDTQWLNTMLAEILTGISDEDIDGGRTVDLAETKDPSHQSAVSKDVSDLSLGVEREKVSGYTNLLASIKEETVSDLQECEQSQLTGPEKSNRKKSDSLDLQSDESERFENAEALVEYVRSSSLEKESKDEDEYKTVSSALGTLISTTAGPLLPDSTSPLPYPPLVTKMWESPVEDSKCFVEVPPFKKKNPFSRNVVEGMKEEDYKLMYNPLQEDKPCIDSMTSNEQRSYLSSSVAIKTTKNIEIRIEDSECLVGDISHITVSPDLGDIPRSKSCGSLKSEGKENPVELEAKAFHGSLNELNKSGDASEGENPFGESTFVLSDEELANRKEKGHLVKMLSFDKNDGTDEASLENKKLSGEESEFGSKTLTSDLSNVEGKSDGSVHSSNTTLDLETKEGDLEPPNSLEIPCSPPINDAGFGWENPDLSPIYEESEDLASSIAKLRSLLTERESQHSLGSLSSHGSSESEPKSAQSDPGRYNLEKSRFTFTHKDSSGSLASVKSVSSLESCGNGLIDEDLLEAAELPLDGRVFLSVAVPATEVHTEPGGAQYTLYNIQYDAIYLYESPPPQSTEADEEVGSESAAISEPRMVLQTNCVKRRFREFLTLHAALEEDSRLRSAMKGVKGPNKWLNLPFSKLDSTTIATRKQFLEKYLQSVILRPELNISTPVKEFLAYGLDSSVTFAKKPLELHVPRLDKLLAKTVSGVFHSIKTALPSFESSDQPLSGDASGNSVPIDCSIEGEVIRSRSSSGVLIERSKLAAFLSSGNKAEYELKLDITAEEEDCQIEEALNIEVSGVSNKGELVDTAYEARETRSAFFPHLYTLQQYYQYLQDQRIHQHSVVVGRGDAGTISGSHSFSQFSTSPFHHLPPPGPRSQGDGCDISTLSERDSHEDSVNDGEEEMSWQEWPLSMGLLEMIVEILTPTDHPLTHQPCVTLLTLTMAKIMHKWLQAELERLFCDTHTAEYIQNIRDAILVTPPEVPSPSSSPEEIARSRVQLEEALKNFLPGVMRIAIGDEVTKQAVTRMVNTIQHPAITMDLALHFLDLLATQLLPVTPVTP